MHGTAFFCFRAGRGGAWSNILGRAVFKILVAGAGWGSHFSRPHSILFCRETSNNSTYCSKILKYLLRAEKKRNSLLRAGSVFYPAFSNISILYGASPRRISYRLFQLDSSWFHSFPRPGKVDVLSCDVEAMIGNYCAPNWGFHSNFAPSQFSAGSI